ncbi:cell division ATP-binding protein FtsE [bacterium BMS3Abin07]|nr:cell division ATP-binding protein FtsE [bacterium BMS3Abin07]GBE33105.1 cell division ATP-binding protein FtsE [bacterium BMS3Bbin05]HDZ88033.1 cell division ATP-binding protein FtsE [Nitrospirota bacterium]
MITFNGVTKAYGNYRALSDISLNIRKGEMAFMTGPSGAGKTTLLKLIYLAERPDTGNIIIAGYNTATLKEKSVPFLRRNIGVVFQDFRLLHNKTVYDNIALALRIRGIAQGEIKNRVDNVLKLVGLRHKAEGYPLSLSGGESQRIAIARAVVGEPTVLLADEPTGNLDYDNSISIMDIFREINAKGTTIFIGTHNHDLFRNTGLRILKLNEGSLAGEGVG